MIERYGAELAAEVGNVGGKSARRHASARVEQRFVGDYLAGYAADARGPDRLDELHRGGAVPALPCPIETAIAKRRIAAAPQVQVSVPDASRTEMTGSEHGGVEPRAG